MRYKVVKYGFMETMKSVVVEVDTGHVVGEYTFAGDAIRKMQQLNRGGGFEGWTPSFILKKVVSDNRKFIAA